MEEITDKPDLIKNSCRVKDDNQRMKRQAIDWEKIFSKDTSVKGLLTKIYKEVLTFRNTETNTGF